MSRTLVITNDFPPRPGGIQAFVHSLASRLPEGRVVVYAPAWRGAAEFDAAQNFPVVRHPTSLMLPEPRVLRRAREIARSENCDSVWFGAAAPLGLLGDQIRRQTGVSRVVASTHGHEVGWAMLPGARQALRAVGKRSDVITYLGEYTRQRLAPAFGPHPLLRQLPSGVDTELFHPRVDGSAIRSRHGLVDRPVVVCVSRLVARKGQDALIRGWPLVRAAVPGAALLLVGGGPYRKELGALAQSCGVSGDVVITGSVPWEELPAHYAAGDVFAMPCRTRRHGLEVEGLGIVYLEAAATGLPVIAGRSGGSPDAVLADETGVLVDGNEDTQVSDAVIALLRDTDRAARMGAAGRAWVQREWRWDVLAQRLDRLLLPPVQRA